ncbi:MAG: acyl-CoA dehydrogenase family protein [Deltaproteobacteria bacterium]|nr:acyl-CoA dehydrogenase family protein [Deltaproteobacteria bacterium]MBW1924160.1 acyl-CoA dehydrogenase family protein [Deltaproteobacteria bacterium]MBW1949929.1 acyl-CoA dehydrogenase family protein [Deltaproteobacteria bacterium]MBW2008460.1 acyl-CoA dehydrogenase family protein [Deltaproteobacteria bacterium]MBW2102223.1 acyl-CoA dehydrogenase family protein [Deltaproteobacteria bacterium]
MDILNYTEEHRIFRQSLRKFLEKEVTPYAEQWEQDGIVPRSVWKKMGDQGFLCMSVPEEYGGFGADFLYSVIVTDELARTLQNGLAAPLHSDIVVPYITAYASEELKHKYLPGCVSGDTITAIAMTEPNAGSDLAGMRTTAVEDGDHVVINGQKTFISNGINCDLLVLAAKDPSVENPHQAVDLYLVEAGTPGFEKGKKIKKVGWHSQDTAELYFTDCRVPKTNRLGQKGGGFLMLMEKLQQERLVCAMGAVATAEVALELTIAYCKERTAFGRPISKFQNSQFRLVEMATEVKLGRTFVDKLIADHMEGKHIVVEVSMAKYWTTEMAMRVADGCVQLHGGYGYCDEYPISRIWRDTRVMSIFAGTNEIMKGVAAKFMGL